MLRPRSNRRLLRTLGTILGDATIGAACLAAAVALRRNVEIPFTSTLLPADKLPLDPWSFALFVVPLVIALALCGFYTVTASPRHRPTLLFAIPLQMGLIATAGMFEEVLLPSSVLVMVAAFEGAALGYWRHLLNTRWARRIERVVLVGDPHDLAAATADPVALARARISIEAMVSLDDPAAHRVIADAEEVIDVSPMLDERRRLELLLLRGPRGFCFLPSHGEALLASERFRVLGDRPLAEVSMRGAYGAGALAKRIFDLTGAVILLILAAPLLLTSAIVILLFNGRPVFLRQERVGCNGRGFGMWKLRTMRPNDALHRATEDDARMTRLGRLLRRYRLDELPQLFNVVSGDMSLVGPRPEVASISDEITSRMPAFALRLCAKPGLAGLAQVSAEYDQSDETKLTYDLQYLCSWSIALDVRILMQALATALAGRGL
ncbi:MAG TPA: sugar transferase [Thermoanaerobaculia bacterium]|nr:sugar transferase [Thermoanaerobaculia bacterium]